MDDSVKNNCPPCDPLVALAKEAIAEFVTHGKTIPPPGELSPDMQEKAGVFVCLKKDGQLRGCIGTFSPVSDNVACEIIRNAISAATEDPRFSPVDSSEIDQISYSIDILSKPERISGPSELDPKRYGVIVVKGYRKGLLLPALETVDTVEDQLRIAKMKAYISPDDDDVELYRFEVRRYY